MRQPACCTNLRMNDHKVRKNVAGKISLQKTNYVFHFWEGQCKVCRDKLIEEFSAGHLLTSQVRIPFCMEPRPVALSKPNPDCLAIEAGCRAQSAVAGVSIAETSGLSPLCASSSRPFPYASLRPQPSFSSWYVDMRMRWPLSVFW